MAKPLSMDDFMRLMLTTWPNAEVHENQTGELVVFTGYRVVNDSVVPVVPYEAF